jgi:hypothetical protein
MVVARLGMMLVLAVISFMLMFDLVRLIVGQE